MDPFEKLFKAKPLRQEKLVYKGHAYLINYMEAGLMKAAHVFGYATNGQIYLSEVLDGRVKRFVTYHEVYHLCDSQTWLGYFGMEFRANFMCGLRDPLGLLATIKMGLKSAKSSLYFRRMMMNDTTLNK